METNDRAAPRTIQIVAHARVFDFVEGWNEIDEQPDVFLFANHAFNFDYLLHLSGINYLIHPDDVDQLISLIKRDDHKVVDYHFRFINRSGEVKHIRGAGRLIPASVENEVNSLT